MSEKPLRSPCAVSMLAIAIGGVLALATGAPGKPLLVWNATPSSPPGLYLRLPGSPRVGDTVLAWAQGSAAAVAHERGYLPAGVPLVKTLAAAAPDPICARGAAILVGGRIAAVRRRRDGAGRPLAWWSGCRILHRGEVLLLGRGDPGSFDGRYFGPTDAGAVIARLWLVWRA